FLSSRRRPRRLVSDWSSDVCSSDLGNIRELSNAMERAVLLCESPTLTADLLDLKGATPARMAQTVAVPSTPAAPSSFDDVIRDRSEERRVGKEGKSGGCRGDEENQS